MSLSRHRRLPREVTDVLRDDPELVRLAERVAALSERPGASRARSRRLLVPVLAAVALAGVAAAVAVVLVTGGPAPSLTDRALAALGGERVLHAVVVRSAPDELTVDLVSGSAVPARVSTESWFDERTRRLHLVQRSNGAVFANVLGARRAVAKTGWRLDPALALFLRGYRKALREGRVRDLGTAVVAGRRVHWLALTSGERVAVDAKSFLPVAIQQRDGSRWSVAEIESVPLSAADFRAPRRQQPVPPGRVISRRRVSPSEAAGLLRLPALWLGRSWGGLQLTAVRVERRLHAYPRAAHRRPFRSRGLVLSYRGERGGGLLELREARRPLRAYGFFDHRTFGDNPIPPEGSVQLSLGANTGQLRTHGLYVTIFGADPTTVIRAARELRPIAP